MNKYENVFLTIPTLAVIAAGFSFVLSVQNDFPIGGIISTIIMVVAAVVVLILVTGARP